MGRGTRVQREMIDGIHNQSEDKPNKDHNGVVIFISDSTGLPIQVFDCLKGNKFTIIRSAAQEK